MIRLYALRSLILISIVRKRANSVRTTPVYHNFHHCLHMLYSSKIQPVLYGQPFSPIFGKRTNGENGYYQYIWTCFSKWPVQSLNAS